MVPEISMEDILILDRLSTCSYKAFQKLHHHYLSVFTKLNFYYYSPLSPVTPQPVTIPFLNFKSLAVSSGKQTGLALSEKMIY